MQESHPMSIRINFRGIELTVSSPSEAAAVARELAEQPVPKLQRVRVIEEPTLFAGPEPDEQRAVGLLELIKNAPNGGPGVDDLMKVLQVDSPKGIGGRMVRINNILLRAGMKPEDAYRNPKTADGRVWKPGTRIQEAIDRLREAHKG